MPIRYAWQLPVKLRIKGPEHGSGTYIIAINDRLHPLDGRNVVHGDLLAFVVYSTLEEARDAAKHLSELRKIKYYE